ncbi:MAG: diaminopimelate epimerase [Acidobacteria bacterium]|jgi:diaminopimelate epimerase|nr:diaminopimelate epimerase [Acidobacteriota bacterium]
MNFYKTVSAGNDFLHISVEDLAEFLRLCPGRMPGVTDLSKASRGRLAELLCHRHTGAGADGVIYYSIGNKDLDFEIFNRDGTEAELSGNGMAGISALMFYQGRFKDRLTLNTRTGSKTHFMLERDGRLFRLKIEIGQPNFNNTTFFPFLERDKTIYTHENISFYPVSVGNPHAVVLLERELPDNELEKMGKILECADIFPYRTNVELVYYEDPENSRIFFYERGVGHTISSSTGSAAVFAVLKKLDLLAGNQPLRIKSPEGEINIYGDGSIYIENFSKIVYKGILMA